MYKEGDMVTMPILEGIESAVHTGNGITICNGLDEFKNVYFHPTSKYSRKKFKEDYPDKNIVIKPEKADVVVLNYTYLKCFDLCKWRIFTKPWRHQGEFIPGKLDYNSARRVNNGLSIVNLYALGKPILMDKNINVKSHYNETMSIEQREGIKMLLKSNDKDMVKLGWNTLFSFDISDNIDHYAVCMLTCNIYRFPGGREYKGIKTKIQATFPNLRF